MTDTGIRRRKPDTSEIKTSRENVKPTPKTAGWTIFVQIIVAVLSVPFVYVAYVMFLVEAPFEVKDVRLMDPPRFVGPLALNTKLQEVEKLFFHQVHGPEAIIFDHGHMYTGDYNGKVVHIERGEVHTIASFGIPPCGKFENEQNCGRPLGLRMDAEKYLVVLDAYKGMFRVNTVTGDYQQMFSQDILIDGEKPKFLNDLDIASDGMIYFTDSSTKWHRSEFINIFLEGENTGRLIRYDPVKNTTQVLLKDLYFANGVQLSRKEDYVLVAETVTARIVKFHLKGPKAGQTEMFADNLPGFPDNIRLARSGGYWVGCAASRDYSKIGLIDFIMKRPNLRMFLAKVFAPETILSFHSRGNGAIVMQINENGEIIRTLQDPTGKVVESVSSVEDHNGILYLGSYKAPFIGKITVSSKV